MSLDDYFITGLTESKPEFAIKWERRKAASCQPKLSNASVNDSSSSSASNSTTSLKETKPMSSNKKSRKKHPKLVDPDWTPQLETSLRYIYLSNLKNMIGKVLSENKESRS